MYGYINIDEEVKKQNIRMSKHGKLSLIVKFGHGLYEGAWQTNPSVIPMRPKSW